MPRKYLRMTRRCTCVTPDLKEEEKMNSCSGSGLSRCIFSQKNRRLNRRRQFLFSVEILHQRVFPEVCKNIADEGDCQKYTVHQCNG